jgi:hypothetical protein
LFSFYHCKERAALLIFFRKSATALFARGYKTQAPKTKLMASPRRDHNSRFFCGSNEITGINKRE